MAAKPPNKIMWWYERLADAMISRPEATLTELARDFNVSLAWLSTIKNSDVFIEYWQRRSSDASKTVLAGIHAKAAAAAEMSLDLINKKLEMEGDALPIGTLLEITDVSMKRFGYAEGKGAAAPTVNFNLALGVASAEELAAARQLMRKRIEAVEEPQLIEGTAERS